MTFVNAPSDFVGEVEFDGTTLRLRVIRGGTTGGEGEGEGETPMDGCGGCFDTSDPLSKQLGDALAMLAGLSILLVSRRMYS